MCKKIIEPLYLLVLGALTYPIGVHLATSKQPCDSVPVLEDEEQALPAFKPGRAATVEVSVVTIAESVAIGAYCDVQAEIPGRCNGAWRVSSSFQVVCRNR